MCLEDFETNKEVYFFQDMSLQLKKMCPSSVLLPSLKCFLQPSSHHTQKAILLEEFEVGAGDGIPSATRLMDHSKTS